MSAWSEAAETLKARIDDLDIENVACVVDRQLDIKTKVEADTAKAGAVAVVILWAGCGITGKSGRKFATTPQFQVQVYASGIVHEAKATRIDDVIERILPAVHEWKPATGRHCYNEFTITGDVDLVPDKKFIIYGWPMECGTINLPNP